MSQGYPSPENKNRPAGQDPSGQGGGQYPSSTPPPAQGGDGPAPSAPAPQPGQAQQPTHASQPGQASGHGPAPSPGSWQSPPPPPAAGSWQSAPPPPAAGSRQSPPPSPAAGYPGPQAAPTPSTTPAGGTGLRVAPLARWMLILVIVAIAVRILIQVVSFLGGVAMGAAGMGGGGNVAMGVTGLLVLGLALLNFAASVGLIVLGIMVAVKASGRGRIGGIVVAATVVGSVIVYWIVYGIGAALGAMDPYSADGAGLVIYLVLEVARMAVVFALLLVGALMARRWARQQDGPAPAPAAYPGA